MVKKALKAIVQGTVQGVFFRNFVKENSDKLGLKGFVRNLESGDVEIVAEGEKEDLQKLVELLKKGPEHAQIRNVAVSDRSWSGDFPDFKILRF